MGPSPEYDLCLEKLNKHRDHILIEINYHRILEFCEAVNSGIGPLPFIEYKDVTEIREELEINLNGFIDTYMDDPKITRINYSGKWEICINRDADFNTDWALHAAFKYNVTENYGIRGM